jgi:WD40 repeat protein
LASLKTNYEANCIAANPTNNHIAVGTNNNRVLIYKISSCGTKMDQLEDRNLDHRGPITCLEYSDDGQNLVAGDANRKLIVYNSSYVQCNRQEMGNLDFLIF